MNKTHADIQQERKEEQEHANRERMAQIKRQQKETMRIKEIVTERIVKAKMDNKNYVIVTCELSNELIHELENKGYYIYYEPPTTSPGCGKTYIEFEKGARNRVNVYTGSDSDRQAIANLWGTSHL